MIKFYKDFLLPTGLLASTIIGAGVFALPYVFARGGFGAGFGYLMLAAGVYAIVHLLYADVIVSTPGDHRFIGYLERYLGRWSVPLAVAISLIETIVVMTIYLILSVSFVHLIVPGVSSTLSVLLFWIVGSVPIFISLRKLTFFEFLIALGMVVIIAAMFILGFDGFSHIGIAFTPGVFADIMLPFGPILFALSGRVAIPSVVGYFKLPGVGHRRSHIPPVIITGTVVPALLYAMFVVGVIGLSPLVTQDALSGLVGVHPIVLTIVGVLGLLALWSSYFVVGLDVRSILRLDLHWPAILTGAVVLGAPPVLYFLGFHSFIFLVSLVGGVLLGAEGLLITAMWVAARRRFGGASPLASWVGPVTIACVTITFGVALVYELFHAITSF